MKETEKIERSVEQQIEANRIFDSFRDELYKRDLSNSENYDKSILTLSAAALGLSLTAIRFITPIETADYLWLIITGWILLVLSIISSLAAFLIGNLAIAVQLKNAEDYYIHCVRDAIIRKNFYSKINTILNILTGIMFSIAITAIVSFVTLNITQREYSMSQIDKGKKTLINTIDNDAISINSANVPTMQQAPETSSTSQSTTSNGDNNSGSNNSSNSNK